MDQLMIEPSSSLLHVVSVVLQCQKRDEPGALRRSLKIFRRYLGERIDNVYQGVKRQNDACELLNRMLNAADEEIQNSDILNQEQARENVIQKQFEVLWVELKHCTG